MPVSGNIGLGSSSGGFYLTQQLIKQQVVGDAPYLARKATEIVDALEAMSKDEILTTLSQHLLHLVVTIKG